MTWLISPRPRILRAIGLASRTDMPITRYRTRLLYTLATLLGLSGLGVLGWAGVALYGRGVEDEVALLGALLTVVAVVCSRFPIRMGLQETFLTLDSIPFVLAAVLLPSHIAVLVVAITVATALLGQPALPGWRGWFWRTQVPLAATIPTILACLAAAELNSTGIDTVLLVEAFVIAALLEFIFDTVVVIELEADEPGSGFAFLRAWPPLAANVFLPAAAVAMLTPYVAEELWQFALLLPVLLVGMYGALWVANSQQMEKRRGERLKDTFSRYVPEGVVDDNLESMQQIELGGEQREVSVLFCDIRGFTTWSEDKGATEVISELNVLLTELSASVMEHGGTLDKFTGDGLMAFWGAPVPVEDHAERACRAALDMLQRLDMVNTRRTEAGQAPFAIGVAVHSGTAVVGNVGHERRLDYTAIGDTVNTTARLESSTKELGAVLLVSRPTVDRLSEQLRSRAMLVGDVVMKGKARPVEAWALQPLRPELEGVDDEFAA